MTNDSVIFCTCESQTTIRHEGKKIVPFVVLMKKQTMIYRLYYIFIYNIIKINNIIISCPQNFYLRVVFYLINNIHFMSQNMTLSFVIIVILRKIWGLGVRKTGALFVI